MNLERKIRIGGGNPLVFDKNSRAFRLCCFCRPGRKKRLAHKAPAAEQGESRRTRGKPRCFYIEIQPKALATELARMMAAKMGHR